MPRSLTEGFLPSCRTFSFFSLKSRFDAPLFFLWLRSTRLPSLCICSFLYASSGKALSQPLPLFTDCGITWSTVSDLSCTAADAGYSLCCLRYALHRESLLSAAAIYDDTIHTLNICLAQPCGVSRSVHNACATCRCPYIWIRSHLLLLRDIIQPNVYTKAKAGAV